MTRVAVIASSGRLAELLARVLSRTADVEVRDPTASQNGGSEAVDSAWLRRFESIVYVPAGDPRGALVPDLGAAAPVFDLFSQSRPPHVVLVSSAAIYGADHHNVGMLDESAFLADRGSEIVRRWMRLEHEARRAAPEAVLAILRPAAVLDGAGYFSRLLSGGAAVTYPGHDPTIQVLSPHDLAGAVDAVVQARAQGVYNVAPGGGIPLRHALRLAGGTRLPLPRKAQDVARALLGPAGAAQSREQLAYIQYSWTVSGAKLRRERGFSPRFTSAEAILEFRGRPTVDAPRFDPFGMDAGYIRRYCRTLFHVLHDYYWRVEIEGLDHVPRQGRGVLVGMHRGFMPFDGVMALYAIETRLGRIPRFLIHPSLTKFPFLGDFMAKLGGIMACQENGDQVLQEDELLGVFPEGIRGAFTMYRRAYTLGKFGRDEFVRFALRHRAPILPFVTVGSAEIYPILGRVDWSWFKRYTEWPFLPLTPTPVPLPSKWHTRFLEPLPIGAQYGPDAADDPDIVRQISLDVRQRMAAALAEMLPRRRSIFAGSIFSDPKDIHSAGATRP